MMPQTERTDSTLTPTATNVVSAFLRRGDDELEAEGLRISRWHSPNPPTQCSMFHCCIERGTCSRWRGTYVGAQFPDRSIPPQIFVVCGTDDRENFGSRHTLVQEVPIIRAVTVQAGPNNGFFFMDTPSKIHVSSARPIPRFVTSLQFDTGAAVAFHER